MGGFLNLNTMVNFFSVVTPDNKKIKIFSDINPVSDYPVLLHFVNNVLKYTYTLNGNSYTIGTILYTPTSGVGNLVFNPESTVYGSYYSFVIDEVTLNKPGDLEHGIHHFMLLKLDDISVFKTTGVLVESYIDCCLDKKLTKVFSSQCSFDDTISDINKIYAFKETIKASLNLKLFDQANDFYKFILNVCNSKCKCGCSG